MSRVLQCWFATQENLLGSSFRSPGNGRPGQSSPGTTRGLSSSVGSTRNVDRYFELKSEIHKKLVGALNMDRVNAIPRERLRVEIGRVVEKLLDDERVPMT